MTNKKIVKDCIKHDIQWVFKSNCKSVSEWEFFSVQSWPEYWTLQNLNTSCPVQGLFVHFLPGFQAMAQNLDHCVWFKVSRNNNLLCVDPVEIMSSNINCEIRRVADSISDNRLPMTSVQPGLRNHWELAIIDPVQVPLDGVDGQFSWIVVCGFVDDLSVCSVHP